MTTARTARTARTATGGSASSQADSIDRSSWTPRPMVSLSIRAAVLIAPALVGVVAVRIGMVLINRPVGRLAFVLWLAALIAVSIGASTYAHRLLRRFAPLAALFKMSLVFPDEAPSRFRTALRNGTTRTLAHRPVGPEQAAAEELIMLIAELGRHDRSTRGHAERVRAYSVMLGEQIGLEPASLDRLNWAALVHDIGKLQVPQELLNSPGRPTNEEWAVLRAHPGAAAAYIEPLRDWLGDWVLAATEHHERYDGGGYPLGLAGGNISLAGRIVSIADAYDVMTAPRSYKPPLPAAQARAELIRNSGTQFDPHLVRSFLEISLGRMRSVPGPLGLLASLPDMIRVPLTAILSSASGAVAAAALSVAAGAGVVNAAGSTPHDSRSAVVLSREDSPQPTSAEGGLDTGPAREQSLSTDIVHVSAVPTTTASAAAAAWLDASGTTGSEPAVSSAPAPPATTKPATAAIPSSTVAIGLTAVAPSVVTPTTNVPGTIAPAPATTRPPATTTAASQTTSPALVTSPTVPTTTSPTSATTTPTPITASPTTTASPPTTSPAGPVHTVADVATTGTNKTVSIHVLQNDTFGGSTFDRATFAVVSAPSLGTATISGQNIVYVATQNVIGTDSFVYRACSLAGPCDQATVVVVVTG